MNNNLKNRVEAELEMLKAAGYSYDIKAIDTRQKVAKLKEFEEKYGKNSIFAQNSSWEYPEMEERYEVTITSPSGVKFAFRYSENHVVASSKSDLSDFTKENRELFAAKIPDEVQLLTNKLYEKLAVDQISYRM